MPVWVITLLTDYFCWMKLISPSRKCNDWSITCYFCEPLNILCELFWFVDILSFSRLKIIVKRPFFTNVAPYEVFALSLHAHSAAVCRFAIAYRQRRLVHAVIMQTLHTEQHLWRKGVLRWLWASKMINNDKFVIAVVALRATSMR